MQPTLIRPDIIVRIGSPFVTEPLSGNEWDKNVYIEEVEFVAPNGYRLIPADGDVLVSGGI